MSIEEITELFEKLNLNTNKEKMATIDIESLINCAVKAALASQKADFDNKIDELTGKIKKLEIKTPSVEIFEEIQILPDVLCDESLDIVKSLPEFNGNSEQYVSWRQAAHTAYKLYENFNGSSKHFQAVAIIRNKIRGPADAVLASFNTVLNFKAIIARLDFTYSDKRPVYLIEQELSTLRQGNQSVLEFYDAIEKKLTLITNKTTMTYDQIICNTLNEKYRADALRTFVSGLKKPLCDILFASRPSDLPTALALAREVDANHERYMFASSFSNRSSSGIQPKDDQKIKINKNYSNNQDFVRKQVPFTDSLVKNPHFFAKPINQYNKNNDSNVEPMDIDPSSSKMRQVTNYSKNNSQKRHANSQRFSEKQNQNVNFIASETERYNHISQKEFLDIEEDSINFLADTPSFHSLKKC